MKIKFCGGAGGIATGACYLIETKGKKVLVDCGLFQGLREIEQKNREPFLFDPRKIDFVLISHAHLDHIGRLPQLIKAGFQGKIFATPPTIDFTKIILEDSVKVLEEKSRRAGVMPIFAQNEVAHLMNHFEAAEYNQSKKLGWGLLFKFYDAGHILGSAIIELETEGRKIIFSGDLGNGVMPLTAPPENLSEADFVLVESTYGDRNHESLIESKEIIENAVEDAVAQKGVLLIPSFALERTQQIIYHLNDLAEKHRIPYLPVFVDSPLACAATEIYRRYSKYWSQEAKERLGAGDDIFSFPGLKFTSSSKESKKINEISSPKIIIAGSGMSQGGRILHHEAKYLSGENNILLLVTYQAAGTLGRKLSDGEKTVEILDQEISVRCRIEKISGYSSHADQRFLMDWMKNFQKEICLTAKNKSGCIKKVFVVHGEEKSSRTLASLISDEIGVESTAPKIGEEIII